MPRRYYIDPHAGDDANTGLTHSQPCKTYAQRPLEAGDTVLFKRGSVVRDILHTRNGVVGGPITYGAYGEGPRPAFLGSIPVRDPKQWTEERPALWRWTGAVPSEVCNLVFDGGRSCGNLRWRIEDLKNAGEWFYTGIGENSGANRPGAGGDLFLFSQDNPGRAYSDIECSLWGKRRMAGGKHVVLDNLSFRNSGVHGYAESRVEHVVIRNCEFRFIGGAVWSRDRRIRFGNAVEFWDGATDVLVERCVFDNIYDSGVTHQGGETSDTPQRVVFRNNLFVNCGMAAYEWRGPSARDITFEHNTCVNAGGGFSMQGEAPPRQSEIYPQPMGHHVFIWRLDRPEELGPIYIRDNIFYEAPYGAAVYSIIDPAEEKKFVLDRNCYWQTTGELLIHMGGKSYRPAEFQAYRKECGRDLHSILADPKFIDEKAFDFRLRPDTPCPDAGM
jgi:hypothetical protein